jgi:hypothetical protein
VFLCELPEVYCSHLLYKALTIWYLPLRPAWSLPEGTELFKPKRGRIAAHEGLLPSSAAGLAAADQAATVENHVANYQRFQRLAEEFVTGTEQLTVGEESAVKKLRQEVCQERFRRFASRLRPLCLPENPSTARSGVTQSCQLTSVTVQMAARRISRPHKE